MRLRRLWPSSPDSHGRDGSGSTATPVQAPTGVVTAAVGVVHSPCDKTRFRPARPAGTRGECPSREGRHTSSPDEDVAKSRTGSRLSHPFQEEMMRMTRGWTGLRAAVIALGLLAGNAPRANANSNTTPADLLQYSVVGNITQTGVTSTMGTAGLNEIGFNQVTNALIDPTSNIPLGSFVVSPLAVGQETTYNNTPFTLTFTPQQFNNTDLGNSKITVSGTLNGSLNGPYQSSVLVSFNSLSNNGFTLQPGSSSTLDLLPGDQKLLVPPSAGGITTMEGLIRTTGLEAPAPEPSTIALFLSTVCGLGLRRYVQVRRQKAQA